MIINKHQKCIMYHKLEISDKNLLSLFYGKKYRIKYYCKFT